MAKRKTLLLLVTGEHIVNTRKRTSTEYTCEDTMIGWLAEVLWEGKAIRAKPETRPLIPKRK